MYLALNVAFIGIMMTDEKIDWRASTDIETIKQRAQMLRDIRAFFDEKNVLEVETPLLSAYKTTDPHLHSFATSYQNQPYYLNTSPEYTMKRLLAQFCRPIFQICKSFRVDELGPNHNPEFTLLEWYRPGFSLVQLMDELEQLLSVISVRPVNVMRESYQSLFEQYANLNPHITSATQCRECATSHQIEIPVGLGDDVDEWLDWLLTQLVLPSIPKNQFTFVYDYPKSQCALAKCYENKQGVTVAARFELFYGENELANGFDELLDVTEQQRRFVVENQKRQEQGLEVTNVDANFLAALENGLPVCSGVAVGLDRLIMALSDKKNIANVISFDWSRC